MPLCSLSRQLQKPQLPRQFGNAVLFPLILWGTQENILPSIKRPSLQPSSTSSGIQHCTNCLCAISEGHRNQCEKPELDQKKKKKKGPEVSGGFAVGYTTYRDYEPQLDLSHQHTELQPDRQPNFKWKRLGFEVALQFGVLAF